jgi:cytochrome c biogenesis protein CcdA
MSHAQLIIAATSSDTATGVGIPLALAAGLVSFLSPCVLPLVPGYLSTVIGVTPADLEDGVQARRVLVPSLLFIASFSTIFILLGLSATVIGSSLVAHKHALEQAGGVVIILLGVVFLATPFVRLLNREWHSEKLLRLAGAADRSSRARLLRSPGRLARASRSARSSLKRPSPAQLPMARCCSPSTRRAWQSPSC